MVYNSSTGELLSSFIKMDHFGSFTNEQNSVYEDGDPNISPNGQLRVSHRPKDRIRQQVYYGEVLNIRCYLVSFIRDMYKAR